MKSQREIFSANLKRILNEKGLSQNELARRIGVQSGTISKWMTHATYPRDSQIQKMADALGVKMSELNTDTSEMINFSIERHVAPPIYMPNEITEVPILGTIACGAPIFSEQNIVGYLPVVSDDVKGGEYFALIAKGDSMYPTIEDGSEVLIRRQPVAENGDIVAVCIDGEITLKRFKQSGEQIMLVPDNHSYDPILLQESSTSYIVGKAKKVCKNL